MKNLTIYILIIFSSITYAYSSTPVMVGGHADLDACLTLAAIVSPNNIKVNIYSKPNDSASVIEKLSAGTHILICDSSGNTWSGIIFSGKPFPSCEVTSSMKSRAPYQGSCQSGWIKNSAIQVLAG